MSQSHKQRFASLLVATVWTNLIKSCCIHDALVSIIIFTGTLLTDKVIIGASESLTCQVHTGIHCRCFLLTLVMIVQLLHVELDASIAEVSDLVVHQ